VYRATLILDDQLIGHAKREAGDRGVTLSELVNAALRNYFVSKPDEGNQSPFTMSVYGDALQLHQSAKKLAELWVKRRYIPMNKLRSGVTKTRVSRDWAEIS
jgi:hypothetical protein